MARVKSNSSLSETHRKMIEFEKKHFQNQQHFPLYDDRSASLTCLYHTATLGDPTIARVKRPTTRRHASDIPPHRENLKPRSYSAGRIPRLKTKQIRKSNSSKKCYSDLDSRETSSSLSTQRSKGTKNKKSVNSPSRKSTKKNGSLSDTNEEKNTNDCVISPAISPAKKSHIGDNVNKSNKIEEHEYLLFLLGVTEDIILNNYYTNEDIERVFREHTELNIDRLSKEKMEQHLIKLADELHIGEAQAENQSTYLKHDPSYTNIQTLKTYTCDCTPDIPLELYSYPSNDYNYYSNSYQNNLDEIIYYRHSLGRVTECTEPSSSTTLTKEISSCPTRSDITLLENLQFDDPNRKLYETRSEVLNLKNNSEDNLQPLKILRSTLSENIVPQKAENINKDSLDKEKWRLNNNQTITVVEENHSCDEDKDCDTEKEQIKKNLEKYKNHKSSSEDIRSNVDTATSNEKFRNQTSRSKFNTETSNANTDKDESDNTTAKPKRNKTHQRKTISNSNTEYSGFATDNNAESSDVNTEKIDDTLDKINQRLKTRPHTKRSKFSNEKKSKKKTSCSSDINTDASDLNSDRTDIGDHNNEQNMSNTDKSIADNGDYKPEEKEKDGFNKYFHLEQINIPIEVNNCNLQLDLTFAKDSLENLAPSPYTTSKSNDMSEVDLQREESKIDVKDNDISVQTSFHKFEDKPEMENKFTQMTYSCSNKACCTNDDEEPVNNNDYILINHPIYVLKSALNSNKNIILEKTNFLSTEETELQFEDDTNKLDLKLLGSDYDLTPERDTTDKCHYLTSDVSTTTSHVQIPSLSSIREENLLLGNLYDLHDGSSQEFEINNDLQLGSATYRCIDNPKALSCDDEIFLRNSEVVVNKNWFSDKSDVEKRSPKKRVGKFKHIRSNVNVSNSTSSASLTC